jgi:hypothetical protein
MSTLLTITERAGNDFFKIEEFVARESVAESTDPSAPGAAGGLL